LPGFGLNYVLGSTMLTLPGGIPTLVADPVVTPGAVAGISETLAWPVAVAGSTLAAYPSEVSLTFDAYANVAMLPGTFVNSGSVIAGATNFTSTANFNVNYDLSVSKMVDKSSTSPGTSIQYTISATNNSPAGVVSNINVNEQLVNGFAYVAGSTIMNGIAAADPYGTANLPVWNLASLPGGTTTTISFTVDVAAWTPDGDYDNLVTLTNSQGTTLASTGPTARVTVTSFVAPPPLLVVSKAVDLTLAKPGDVVTYTVTTSNTGQGVASSVFAVDHLSRYTKVALDPWANGTPVQLIDGPSMTPAKSASNLTVGTIEYSTDGINFQPLDAPAMALLDDGTGYAPLITDLKVNMVGIMDSNQANNPTFILEYKAKVE